MSFGQFDIGGAPDPITGIPTGLTTFADGTETYIMNNGIATDGAGMGVFPYVMPASMPLGVLTTFQAILFNPTGIAISNAIEIEVTP